MKKIVISLILVTVSAILALSACTPAQENVSPTEAPAASETATAPTAEETPENTAAPTETPAPTEAPPTEAPTPTEVPSADPSIEKGTNVALGAEVDFSSSTGEAHVQWGFSYEFINDGIREDMSVPSLGWCSEVGVNFDDPYEEEWIELFLEKYTLIDTVKVFPARDGTYFPIDFYVEVSLDGRSYSIVASAEDQQQQRDHSSEPTVLTFEPITARFVRLVITRRCDAPSPRDGYLVQIGELEVIAA